MLAGYLWNLIQFNVLVANPQMFQPVAQAMDGGSSSLVANGLVKVRTRDFAYQ